MEKGRKQVGKEGWKSKVREGGGRKGHKRLGKEDRCYRARMNGWKRGGR